MITIRAGVPDDCQSLLKLIHDHAVYEGSRSTLTSSSLSAILRSSGEPATILVAVQGRDLKGYAALTYDFSLWRGRRWAHLDCLFVCDTARNLGIGAKLLHGARDLARSEGADRLEWQTPEWNQRAAEFYAREGAAMARKMRFSLPLAKSTRSHANDHFKVTPIEQ